MMILKLDIICNNCNDILGNNNDILLGNNATTYKYVIISDEKTANTVCVVLHK